MRSRSLIMGNERTDESRKEMRKSPGAPSPLAKAIIFCFQLFRFTNNRNSHRQLLPCCKPPIFSDTCTSEPSMHPEMETVQSSRQSVECGSSAAAFAIVPLPQSKQ